MDVYAGYYKEEKKLRESSSGGAASAIAEKIVQKGGIVYGAAYAVDFYSAIYGWAEKEEELKKFKGSKYVYVNKSFLKDGKKVSVYEQAMSELRHGRIVLFTGLGCDIAALKSLARKELVNTEKLFTIELLCDGVTNEVVHEKYVLGLEKIYSSKAVAFSVRYKKEGWVPLYIYTKFENGKEHICPFYGSEYGFAFQNYKRKSCYNCPFKNQNHLGDLIVADFWGCRPGMKEYNENGVSLLFIQSEKGKLLLDYLDIEHFFLKKVDTQYALYYSPRYFSCHERYPFWKVFDRLIKTEGLQEAVKVCSGISMPERFKNKKISEIILWGAGKCFHQYISLLQEMYPIKYVIDSDKNKWEQEVENGIVCKSSKFLENRKDFFILIMVENISIAFQIANRLLDIGITEFDYIHNWFCYANRETSKNGNPNC